MPARERSPRDCRLEAERKEYRPVLFIVTVYFFIIGCLGMRQPFSGSLSAAACLFPCHSEYHPDQLPVGIGHGREYQNNGNRPYDQVSQSGFKELCR